MNAVKHYFWGLAASAMNGGVSTVAGIIGIDGASLTGLSNQARILNTHEMISAFVGALVVHGLFWLKAHPLPENYPFDSDSSTPTNKVP